MTFADELQWMYATDRSAYLCKMNERREVVKYIAVIQRIRSGEWSSVIYGFPPMEVQPNRVEAMRVVIEALKP